MSLFAFRRWELLPAIRNVTKTVPTDTRQGRAAAAEAEKRRRQKEGTEGVGHNRRAQLREGLRVFSGGTRFVFGSVR